MRKVALAVPLCLLALLASGACRGQQELSDNKPARPKVNLPPTPPLELKPVRTHAEDGSFTVAGLLQEREKQLGQTVRVTGIVIDKHVCPQAAPVAADPAGAPDAGAAAAQPEAEPEPEPCYPPPHLTLADDMATTRSQLLVAGEQSQIESHGVGARIAVQGRFGQWSDDHVFVRSEGLVQLPRPEPPPAPAAADVDAGAGAAIP